MNLFFLLKSMTFKGSSERTPPSYLLGREHLMDFSCVPTLRGAEAKELIGRQDQNCKHERGSDLFQLPLTRIIVAPNSSLRREKIRSAPKRFRLHRSQSGAIGLFNFPRRGLASMMRTPPRLQTRFLIAFAS